MSANRVAAIKPPIDDTDTIRKFSIDPESHSDWQKQAEFSPKGKPIRNFSIDPTSSMRTPIADAIFADAISETPRVSGAVSEGSLLNPRNECPEQVIFQSQRLQDQEWPRQTKPKKGQFMNFPQGHSGTKVQCESCLFSQGKTPEFTKMAGATPDPGDSFLTLLVGGSSETPPASRSCGDTCGRGRCELPAMLRLTPKIANG